MRISVWSSDVCSSDLQPALLAWGAHDRVIDPGAMDLYAARMPQARKVLLGGSGHMTVMEQIGSASCRERVCQYVSISVVCGSLKKKSTNLKVMFAPLPFTIWLK